MTRIPDSLLGWQQDQYEHDRRNHFHILSLHKEDRLKHYALHFGKYAGRLARGTSDPKSPDETCIDGLLVCLSAANTLHQHLTHTPASSNATHLIRLTSAAGKFCDAAEKIDHLEPFLDQASESNQELCDILLDYAIARGMDLEEKMRSRRAELKARKFFIR